MMEQPLVRLSQILAEPTCVVGVGNELRGDDGIGLYLLDRLQEIGLPEHVGLVRAEDIPESYVLEISRRNCRTVVFADAVEADVEPGSVVFGRFRELDSAGESWSTHRLALSLCAELLEQAGKPVYLVGISAMSTEPGASIHPTLKVAADRLGDLMVAWAKGTN